MTSWTDVAGWTLVHFVWQGTVIALATAGVLRLLRGSRPQLRYAVACIALAMMLAAPVATAVVLRGAPRTAFSESIHVLRVDGGPVLGVAIVPPWSSARTDASGTGRDTARPPAEFRLPVPVNTNTLFSTLITLWVAGVMILLTRLAAGCLRVRRLHHDARLEAPSRWQMLAEDLAARLRLRRPFLIVDSARVSTPTVIGWLRPVVLLPVAALAGLTPRQVEAILAHELAHIRRHDFLINLLQTLAETALFYHPAVWWISSRIRTEREHCCDDVAVSVCGDAREYAAALTELASWSIAHPPLAMAATRGPLLNRVRRLLRLEESDRRFSRTTLAVAVVLTTVFGVVALGAILKAQPIGDDGGRFGPPQINRMLGFRLFPGPATLPTDAHAAPAPGA
jgi:beta-lactamase regulating signal transducer with metallopeptidase domain